MLALEAVVKTVVVLSAIAIVSVPAPPFKTPVLLNTYVPTVTVSLPAPPVTEVVTAPGVTDKLPVPVETTEVALDGRVDVIVVLPAPETAIVVAEVADSDVNVKFWAALILTVVAPAAVREATVDAAFTELTFTVVASVGAVYDTDEDVPKESNSTIDDV